MSDPDFEAKPSRKLWVFAGLTALALHVGGAALAIAHLRTDDPDEDLGAPAIEIGLEMAAPKSEATDLPPGPDSDASVASPALPEQQGVRGAVNQEFAGWDAKIADGDEVAFIPPVSGGIRCATT